MQEQTRNDVLETLKRTGFVLIHAVGWVAYLPLVVVILIFYGGFVLVIANTLGWLGQYIGYDGMRIMQQMVFLGASIGAFLLRSVGIPAQFDPRRVGVMQVPGMLIGSIIRFVRPNRLTFLLGSVFSAYLLVMTVLGLIQR